MAATNNQFDMSEFANVPETVKGEGHHYVYANSTRMGVSPWDVQIAFGQVVEGELGKAINEVRVTVVMTPAQAKSVLHNLTITVKNFEDMFGEIGDPLAAIRNAKIDQQLPKVTPPGVAKLKSGRPEALKKTTLSNIAKGKKS